MALISLKFPPGVLANGTKYQSRGFWRDAQLMRFREGAIRPVGGWLALASSGASITTVPRTLLSWRANGISSPLLAVGTPSKVFSFTSGVITDRTIYGLSVGTTSASLTGNAYGAGAYGAGVYGSGDTAQAAETAPGIWHLDNFGSYLLGCLAPSDGRLLIWDTATATMQPVSNTAGSNTFTVSGSISDADTLTIDGKVYTWQTALTNVDGHVLIGATNATALANMAAAINLGTGAGTLYATATTANTTVTAASSPTTVVITQRVYSATAIVVSEVANGTWGTGTAGRTGNAPNVSCLGLVVTGERFLMALGVRRNGAGNWETEPRSVAWAAQESLGAYPNESDWVESSSNTAGDFTLSGSGRIICGRRGRNETLIFTDTDLFAAQYIGGTLVYAFTQLGSGCGIVGPNAVAVMDGKAAWLGTKGFYVYDGFVRPAPTEVTDYVFGDFNRSQQAKCFALVIAEQNVVQFHYPSSASSEPDRYVAWNYVENHWTPGKLARTAGIDRGAFTYPILAKSDGTLYEHERGTAHAGETAPYLESGPIEIAEGDQVMMVRQIIPDDITRANSGRSVQAYLYSSLYPNDAETTSGPFTLTSPTSLRVSARQVRLKITEIVADDWRVGTVRLDVAMGGLR